MLDLHSTFLAAGTNGDVLIKLLLMLAAAKLMAEIFERFKQPAVVGEILAGVILGGSILAWVKTNEIISVFAEIGVIFLMFTVGLETKPAAILRVGKTALVVGVLGVILPFLAGWLIMLAWDGNRIEAMFVGAAMVATSVGITARVLSSLGLLDAPTARIILGAAVIDDILGLLILAIVTSFATGEVNYTKLVTTTVLSFAFTIFVAVGGSAILTKIAPRIEKLRIGEPFFIFGLILCLGLSVAATFIGIAAIIGAFLAGMALAEATEHNKTMHKQTAGITEFLVPFFLVNIGLQLNLAVFQEWNVIGLALIITLAAIITKFIGCGIGALSMGKRRAAQVGVGMIPRGEVGIVVAQIGLSLKVIDDKLFGVVLFMAIATTLIAPPFMRPLFANEPAATGKIDDDDAGGILATHETEPPALG